MCLTESEPRLLYLSKNDVAAAAVPMAEVVSAVLEAFRRKGAEQTEMPPKPAIHPRKDSFIHAMPAYIRGMDAAGVKWISGYPANRDRGLPYISGLLLLNDAETGLPIAVMDCAWITAVRTGAATAVAAKYLARPTSTTLGLLGCGVQGRSNLRALREVLPIDKVVAYDVDKRAAEAYAAQMSEETGAEIRVVDTPRQAVEQMDVVVTAGPILYKPHATIEAHWLTKGTFVSPVDFDSYFSRAALKKASRYCTDDKAQYASFAQMGYFAETPPLDADLGELVVGTRPGRQSTDEITICVNLGLAIEDIAVASLIYKRARQVGVGTWLPL